MLVYWVKDSGKEVPLGAMSSRHIQNCIQFIRSGQMLRPGCNGFSNAEWIQIFKVELNRRCK